jgi:uncharacterized protein DUF4153
MRFLSIENLAAQARDAARRFAFVLLSAATATGAAIALIDHNDSMAVIRVLLPALLGLPAFTALVTWSERASWSAKARAGSQAAVALLLVALWFALGRWTEPMELTRFAHLAVLAHLAVAVLPFVGTRLDRAFWQFNRLLFVRYLTGGIFAAVLFAGLAIALAAIDKLFGVHVAPQWYGRLWVVMALLFHPWFFLGGVPRDLNVLESREDYPTGLKVFAQFILIPVVTVYLVILTAYLVKVVVTRTWPSGWIGYLVSSVAAAGTLALLLVHPIRERSDSRWVDAYGRWFFVALLPSIGMLLMAIWLRVDQYGLTENRYFLAVLALWLGAIAVYYGITGSRNIRVIPLTLGAVAVVTFVGPWSAYAVSRNSQLGRLREALTRTGILAGSRLQPPPREVSFNERREMSDLVRYLVGIHGPRSLAAISDTLRRVAENVQNPRPNEPVADEPAARAVMDQLGMEYVSRWQGGGTDRVTNFVTSSNEPMAVEGYDWVTTSNLSVPFTVALGADTLAFAPDSLPIRLGVSRHGQRLLDVPLWPLVEQARAAERSAIRGVLPPAGSVKGVPAKPPAQPPLRLDAEGNGLRLRLIVRSLRVTGDSARAHVSADATILLRFAPR